MRPLPSKKLGLSLDSMDWGKKKRFFLSFLLFCNVFFLSFRSAVKSFGIERFKQNCTKATEGFNHVLYHLHYMKQVREKKWTEMKEMKQKGVEAIRDKMTATALANAEESWKLKSSYTFCSFSAFCQVSNRNKLFFLEKRNQNWFMIIHLNWSNIKSRASRIESWEYYCQLCF